MSSLEEFLDTASLSGRQFEAEHNNAVVLDSSSFTCVAAGPIALWLPASDACIVSLRRHACACSVSLAEQTPIGAVKSQVVFIPYGNTTWRITAVTPSGRAERHLGRALTTALSFVPPNVERREPVTTMRLLVVSARSGENIETLSRRTSNVWTTSETAVYNGIFTNHVFGGGELVKVARFEPVEVLSQR